MSDDPEFLDVSSRPAPVPGPFTKPVATQRPRRNGQRWLLAAGAAVLLTAVAVVGLMLLLG